MHPIDWLILAVPVVVLVVIAGITRRHVQGVSDFMAGGRVAGRYIVAVSDGVAAMGLITAVGMFEFIYHSGFAINHWGQISTPIMLIVTLSGFVIYRFRETRALTLAQFFEVRYSKRFRIFAGLLAWVAGVLNYGIFPAVAGRFFVAYCGLPETLSIAGLVVPTFVPAMFVFLCIALALVLPGGQLTTMVTDCVQGLMSYALYIVIAIAILSIFSWDQMSTALLNRPEGKSMLNPMDTHELTDFNLSFVLIGVFGMVYVTMAWQGNSGYNCAAENAQEAKMGKMLGTWRANSLGVMFALLAVAAYTYLNHPDFATAAQPIHESLASMDNEAVAGQVRVPMAISSFLPVGVVGAFLAVMMLLMISTDTTYLHSWGSILIQDIVLPIRKRAFTPKQQLFVLRLAIAGIALFAFVFSWYYHQTTQIFMFFALTGSIYLGGAGAVIIGGLYWKRATTAGAWAAMLAGSCVAATGFVLEHYWAALVRWWTPVFGTNDLFSAHPDDFPVNGQWMWLISMLSAIAVFVLVSLMTCREPFNMQRMLHRGPYRRPDDQLPDPPRSFKALLGVDKSFSKNDRVIASFICAWGAFFFCLWVVVTGWNLVSPWPEGWWATYFWINGVGLALLVSVLTSIWFTWGGVRDLRRLFAKLAHIDRDIDDDGRVIGHVNADEACSATTQTTPNPHSETRAENKPAGSSPGA